ncbi:MAG: ribosome recycling factor [Opitutales bacterium]
MDIQAELKNVKTAMDKVIQYVIAEFDTIHTGKASSSMVENISVEVYGSMMKIKEVAAITTPDAQTIRIQAWDKEALKPIEKAILAANVGLTPSIMGEAVRCPVPALSGERRLELIKVCGEMAEQGRVRVRNVRREAMDLFKKSQKASLITEDELKKTEKDIQNLTDKSIDSINKDLASKEAEVKKV